MTDGKSALLALWLGLIFIACASPFALLMPRVAASRPVRLAPKVLAWALLPGSTTFLALGGAPTAMSPVVLSLAFLAPLLGEPAGVLLGGLAALPLLAATTWWAPKMALDWSTALVFLFVGLIACTAPRLTLRRTGAPLAATCATMLVLAAIGGALTGQFGSPTLFWAIWHHWGAYVSPVQSMLAGGTPYRDFPIQYGMGPTLLISAFGGKDPWMGTYAAATCVNALYLLAMSGCVGLTLLKAPRGLALLAMFAIACATLLWTGYPPDEAGPMMTPSVDGMRFLPLALLMLLILWSESIHRLHSIWGYVLWLLSVAWSPEACVYSTIIWFPYLFLRSAQEKGVDTPVGAAWAALRGAAVAVASLAAAAGILTLLFFAAFGNWPSVSGFLTYIVSPPGILAPNPRGPIWLLLAALAVGVVSLTRGDARSQRVGTVCNLALIAVSSYYLLGRAHDNNVLNLFPFVVLALAAALAAPLPQFLTGFSRMILVGIVAWPATFGFQSWTAALRNGDAAETGPNRMLDRFRLITPEAWTLLDAWLAAQPGAALSSDAGAALAWLAGQGAESPLVVNQALIIPRYAAGPTWTGVNNLANFDLLPRDVIVHFIRNGATSFHRPGWILADRAHGGDWLDLFGSAYSVTEERVFGGYSAYRLIPK